MRNMMLLVDSVNDPILQLDLMETAHRGSLLKFRGKFQEADAVNKNQRKYTHRILDENVRRLNAVIESRRLMGELDHPTDSIVHLNNVSHLITKLWWEGKVMMGEGEILNTPSGHILRGLIEGGINPGISSRGIGNGTMNNEGILVIDESYRLITFDIVADPSTHNAFQERVAASKSESYVPATNWRQEVLKNRNNGGAKNESTGIGTFDKDVLLAWVGEVVKSTSQKYKS